MHTYREHYPTGRACSRFLDAGLENERFAPSPVAGAFHLSLPAATDAL
jgi:hypothetical protein